MTITGPRKMLPNKLTLALLPPSSLLLLASPMAFANELNGGNTSWVLTSSVLVLMMTLPGLSLFYAGLVRSKNALSVLMQCFTIACIVSIVWLVAGYSLAFDDVGNGFIGGLGNFLLSNVLEQSMFGDIPESSFALFQVTFAIITVALIMGGLAERIKFSAVVLFTILWVVFVYAPIAHWVWGGGWLGGLGVLDFAGGNVVHITAGVAALVGALMLGKRNGFPSAQMTPHNMTLTMIGAGMLWVGWFGFNGGSALAANEDAAMAMLVTHICAATAAIGFVVTEYIFRKSASALGAATGMVAGLVAVTPASGFVGPAGALIIGAVSGPASYAAIVILKQKFKIDDSLDVFPVHGVAGIVGTMLTGVFAAEGLGVFSGQGIDVSISTQLGLQFVGVAATIVYTAIVTYVVFKIVGMLCGGLRVDQAAEVQGLDLSTHEERGYNM